MIQVNLIPDIKAEFLKAQSNKRVVIMLSIITSGAFLAIVILMWSYVSIFQGSHTKNLESDIAGLLTEYRSPEDASKVLTVNNQLVQLTDLHSSRPAATRLPGYLSKLIPDTIIIDSFNIDFEDGDATIKGLAKEPRSIDRLISTFNNAVYYIVSEDDSVTPTINRVFKNTKLARTGITEDGDDTFEITTVIDTEIFRNSLNIVVTIPNTSTDEVEFITPEELTKLPETTTDRTEDLFAPIPEGDQQ